MTDPNNAAVTESSSPRLEKAMFPKRYAECKVDGNEVLCHSDRVLLAMSEYESELASLRQKQVLWEAGNRELADRLEARDVAIDALRAEKERAEAEVARLNQWADSFTDAHLKERQTGDALVKEVMQRALKAEAERDAANAELDQTVGAIKDLLAERDAALKDAERFRFRHSNYIDADGYEYGYCKVRWKNGNVESMLWASDEEIDAAIAARKGEQ